MHNSTRGSAQSFGPAHMHAQRPVRAAAAGADWPRSEEGLQVGAQQHQYGMCVVPVCALLVQGLATLTLEAGVLVGSKAHVLLQ